MKQTITLRGKLDIADQNAKTSETRILLLGLVIASGLLVSAPCLAATAQATQDITAATTVSNPTLPTESSSSDGLTMTPSFLYPYTYTTDVFVFGDTTVPYGLSNSIESFSDDEIVFDSNDHTNGILPSYIQDRASSSDTVAAYAGIEDIASLWEGHSVGSITIPSTVYSVGGVNYTLSGTVKVSTLYADEDGVSADFYPVEDGCSLEGVNLSLSVPTQAFTISSKQLTIVTGKTGAVTTVKLISFPATYSLRATYGLDYGSTAINGLLYESSAVMGCCPANPTVQMAVTSGTLSPSTVTSILQIALCTSGNGAFAQGIAADAEDMAEATEDGFGQYFTDSLLRFNPLTQSGSISYQPLRYHDVDGANVAEMVITVGRMNPATSGSFYLVQDSIQGNGTNLEIAQTSFEDLLTTLIPSALLNGTGGDPSSAPASSDCDVDTNADGSYTLNCDCTVQSGLSECDVTMTMGAPVYVWSYTDESGTTQSFDVTFGWRSGDEPCDAPVRKVRARHMAFHVPIDDIYLHGKKSGIGFNIYGDGGFTVEGLTLAIDLETMSRRGNPDHYDCMDRTSYCLTTLGAGADTEDLGHCLSDNTGSEGGPSGERCPLAYFTAMSDLVAAEDDYDLYDATDEFDDAIEPSTLSYLDSYISLDDYELSMHFNLDEDNILIGEDMIEDMEQTLEDTLSERINGNLETLAAKDNLLGGTGVLLGRIHGYQIAKDLADTAGMSFDTTFQVDVYDSSGKAEWTLVDRNVVP